MLPPTVESFGKTHDEKPVDLYTLANRTGMEVAITNYGATVVSLKTPDRNGNLADIVLGYDALGDYERDHWYFGATVGRYANRIAGGRVTIDGEAYTLSKNDGPNTLHGGNCGFNKRVWTAQEVSGHSAQALQFKYLSEDGEEGFPGNLSVSVTMSLPADRNDFRIDYAATTEGKDTVLNLTNHSYFNLSGAGSGTVLHDELRLCASQFTPVDASMIPTGDFRDVKGTPFDFLRSTTIGQRIGAQDKQLEYGKGYDHNWVLHHAQPASLDLAAEAYDRTSGRLLRVLTTQPGIQFYTGNFLNGVRGKNGKMYPHRSAFCLETQHFPDSPNHPEFPSTVLTVGQRFRSSTIYQFSIR
jgi:aldose 1-epimerase